MNRTATALIFRIVFAAFIAAMAADAGRYLYHLVTGFPLVNWSISGRWFLMVLGGQIYVPDMSAAPALPHELIAGRLGYYTIAISFAAVYLFLVERVLKRPPGLASGLLFGWATLVFPLFLQMPAMGLGILASATETPLLIVLRTVVHHTCFGLFLPVGAALADRLTARRAVA
jgi:hypothetical protein